MASVIALAQALPSTGSGVDWLYQFTNNLTNLTTQNGGALTQFGAVELSAISLFVLVSMVVNWNTSTMTFRVHHEPVRAGDLVNFLMRLITCSLLLNYWVNPFPGASFGINHFFSYIAQAMVAAFDQSSLDNLLQLLKSAGDGTPVPSFTAPTQISCYFIVQLMLGLASAILFVINCSSFILYGVPALFGPVFIPLRMTKTFRTKFFHFLDVLISFAMIRYGCVHTAMQPSTHGAFVLCPAVPQSSFAPIRSADASFPGTPRTRASSGRSSALTTYFVDDLKRCSAMMEALRGSDIAGVPARYYGHFRPPGYTLQLASRLLRKAAASQSATVPFRPGPANGRNRAGAGSQAYDREPVQSVR